jgi:hypothetical protein
MMIYPIMSFDNLEVFYYIVSIRLIDISLNYISYTFLLVFKIPEDGLE